MSELDGKSKRLRSARGEEYKRFWIYSDQKREETTFWVLSCANSPFHSETRWMLIAVYNLLISIENIITEIIVRKRREESSSSSCDIVCLCKHRRCRLLLTTRLTHTRYSVVYKLRRELRQITKLCEIQARGVPNEIKKLFCALEKQNLREKHKFREKLESQNNFPHFFQCFWCLCSIWWMSRLCTSSSLLLKMKNSFVLSFIRHAVEFAWLNSVINRVVCYSALDYVMESQ